MHNDGVATTVAATFITSPIWLNFVEPTYQVILAFLGFVLLVLTIRNKWMDLKIKSATLAEIASTMPEIKDAIEAKPPAEVAATVEKLRKVVDSDGD